MADLGDFFMEDFSGGYVIQVVGGVEYTIYVERHIRDAMGRTLCLVTPNNTAYNWTIIVSIRPVE